MFEWWRSEASELRALNDQTIEGLWSRQRLFQKNWEEEILARMSCHQELGQLALALVVLGRGRGRRRVVAASDVE